MHGGTPAGHGRRGRGAARRTRGADADDGGATVALLLRGLIGGLGEDPDAVSYPESKLAPT
jgi:hypothetical protein